MARKFLSGVGTALLFRGNDLIGVAKTLTESTFAFSITAEEIRGGRGNALFGKYFHDSNLTVTLTDAMFNLEYIAASLGVSVEQGGISVYESSASGEQIVDGSITLANTPVAFDGALIGWYKKPTDSNWSIGTITSTGNNVYKMSIQGATANASYCVKYFYNNPNARSITIPTQYVPDELHVTILNDLYNADIASDTNASIIGRLITDIPRLQMDGNQNLALTATGAATTSLSGSALAVESLDTCETEAYYGTMTEEEFNAVWQDNVVALAIENADIDLKKSAKEKLIVRAVYGGSTPSQRKDNSNFTFTVETGGDSFITVDSTTGEITATAAGTAYVSVALKQVGNKTFNVAPAIAQVTVTA